FGGGPAVAAVQELLERVPPDRPADREADEALDRRGLLEPVVDLLVRRAAAEEHALDALAAVALARLRGEHLRVLARVDALDLPYVDLDALVLEVLDHAPHELGAQLGVVAVGIAADRLELVVLGGHEQLEEEEAVVGVQPVRERLQARRLAV